MPCRSEIAKDCAGRRSQEIAAMVDVVLRVHGRIAPRDLVRVFGMSRAQASRTLGQILKCGPVSPVFDAKTKAWSLAQMSQPPPIGDLVDRMRGEGLLGRQGASTLGVVVEETLPAAAAHVAASLTAIFVRAIASGQAVSFRKYGGEQATIASPVGLFHASGEVHVRFWDHVRDVGRELPLSRIEWAEVRDDIRPVPNTRDKAWWDRQSLTFRPARAFGRVSKRGELLRVSVRRALVPYVTKSVLSLCDDYGPFWEGPV